MTEGERLEIVRWHLARADEQRAWIWNRASSVLSANALVIAGAALLAGAGDDPNPAVLLITLLPIVASVMSVFQASQVLGSVFDFGRVFANQASPAPVLTSLQFLSTQHRTYDEYRAVLESRTVADEIDDAAGELWRIGLVHARRSAQMRTSLRWFVSSVALLVAAAVADVIVLIIT